MPTTRLPAGPSLRALQTLRFSRDVERMFVECAARYGDPFTLRILPFDAVVTGHPDGIREISAPRARGSSRSDRRPWSPSWARTR